MKNIILIALAIASLGACNTIEGMGKDVSSAARGVKDALPDSPSSGSSSSSSYDTSVQSSSY